MRYLDIDLILSEEERLPVVFITDVIRLGFLDQNYSSHPNNPSQFLSKDTNVELPLWLSIDLAKYNMVKIETPKYLGSKMRDEISANASNINLRDFTFYFFEVGMNMCKLLIKDKDLPRILRIAFCDRLNDVLIRSFSNHNNIDDEYIQKLTSLESRLYFYGINATQQLQDWKMRKSLQIQKSNLMQKFHNDHSNN